MISRPSLQRGRLASASMAWGMKRASNQSWTRSGVRATRASNAATWRRKPSSAASLRKYPPYAV